MLRIGIGLYGVHNRQQVLTAIVGTSQLHGEKIVSEGLPELLKGLVRRLRVLPLRRIGPHDLFKPFKKRGAAGRKIHFRYV